MALGASVRGKLLKVVLAADDNFLESLFQRLTKDETFREQMSRLSQLEKGDDLGSRTQLPSENDMVLAGESRQMLSVIASIQKFAATALPILITGETGTGKDMVALAIHRVWPGSSRPFVTVNCGALPPTLIASELFGHERGAFTGAFQRRIGHLEAAKGGTIFLDEIGDLPLELQPHLLRFLQDGTIERLGGNDRLEVNARVIAATNIDLREAVRNGRFRQDLYYRLGSLTIDIPPLRQRDDDIILLAALFLRQFAAKMGRPILGYERDALDAMLRYNWPGNVRELISRIRRAIIVSDEPWLNKSHLGFDRGVGDMPGEDRLDLVPIARDVEAAAAGSGEGVEGPLTSAISLEEAKARTEERLVRAALARTSRNIRQAAQVLGVSRVTLYRLMDKYGVRSGIAETD